MLDAIRCAAAATERWPILRMFFFALACVPAGFDLFASWQSGRQAERPISGKCRPYTKIVKSVSR